MSLGSGKSGIEVDLNFNANTRVAKEKIEILQKQLTNLMKSGNHKILDGRLSKELEEASEAAASLKAHLEQAVDVKTGKLDLGLLNKSFKDAGVDLSTYREKLSGLGKDGQKAFSNLAQAILQADVPLKQTSALMDKFSIALKNTMRWQISSSMLHGFMGSVQSAFGYAKDLNESLNNIRIVTGQNTDQMADFAKEANKAAQALNTTTTKYTDAALIYYQQGLSDKEVQKRTDVTIKMANVSRQSAEEVSSQMTAVWNNFNKEGDESEEHFADVMTKLGAETASSSQEIAEGLSKFSGVANTVGLSFDYAASALATITATSRESADVVGTSLKTIFARLQGLKLGKTLEDGTELNQYSQGLAKIGVNIKEASGELKDMDTILDETGAKWKSLTEDQKMATAQTVAGVRQYNQFITLMDNWDFMEKNLQRAKDSTGTLQQQADIYAESWEAAEKRVQAAAEEVYSKLLDDDFFIDANNSIADFLGLISNTIDALGGLNGVLTSLGMVALKIFKDDLGNSIDRFVYNLSDKTAIAQQMRQSAVDNLTQLHQEEGFSENSAKLMAEPQQAFIDNAERLSDIEKKTYTALLEQNAARVTLLRDMEEEAQLAEKTANIEKKKILVALEGSEASEKDVKQINYLIDSLKKAYEIGNQVDTALNDALDLPETDIKQIAELFKEIDVSTIPISNNVKQIFETIQSGKASATEVSKALTELMEIQGSSGLGQKSFDALSGLLAKNLNIDIEEASGMLENFTATLYKSVDAEGAFELGSEEAKKAVEGLIKAISESGNKPLSFGQSVVSMAQGLGSLAMAINSIKGLGDLWSNEDISNGEKLLSTITSLGMTIPMIASSFKGLKEGWSGISSTLGPVFAKMAVDAGVTDVAIKGATLSTVGFSNALKGLAAAHPILLALTVAIGAIAAAWAFAESTWNSAAEEAEEAAKASGKLAEEFNNTKDAYDKLKKDLEDYHTAKDALKDLTVGTREWKEAIVEVNDKVLDLINQFPELASQVRNVNGVLELNENAEKTILDKQLERVNQARQANVVGHVVSNSANETNKITQTTREMTGLTSSIDEFVDAQAGHMRENQATIYEDSLKRVIDAFDKYGGAIFANTEALEESSGVSEETAKAFIANGDKIQSLVTELSNARDQSREEVEQSVIELLQKEGKEQTLKDKTQIDYLTKLQQEEIQNRVKEWDDSGSHTDEEAQQKYAELMGYKNSKNLDDNKGEYTKADGTTVEIDDKVAREAVAAAEATEHFRKNLSHLQKTFKESSEKARELANGNKETGDNLLKLIQGNLKATDLTEKQADELAKIELNKDSLSEEDLRDMGVDPATFNFKEINNALKNIGKNVDIESVADSIAISAKQAFQRLDYQNLTLGAAQNLAKGLEKTFLNGGQSTLSKLELLFKDASKEGKAEEFANSLKEIPWDSVKPSELKKSLSEMGVQTTLTDESIRSLINSMKSAEATTVNMSDQWKDFAKITKDLKIGDIVSEEDYNKLTAINEKTEEYFVTLLDGTHQLIGDAKELKDVTKEGLIKDKLTEISKQRQNVQNLEYLSTKYKLKEDESGEHGEQGISGQVSTKNYTNDFYGVTDVGEMKDQIALVQSLGEVSEDTKDKLGRMMDDLNHGIRNFKSEDLNLINDQLQSISEKYPTWGDAIAKVNKDLEYQRLQIAMTAESYSELEQMRDTGKISQANFDFASSQMHEKERMEGLDSTEISQYGGYLQELARDEEEAKIGSEELSEELKDNAELARDLAVQVSRLDAGVQELSSNWKTWSKVLKEGFKSGSKGSKEFFKAQQSVKKALADLFDISEDYVSLDLVEKFSTEADSMELMEKAAKGDGDAIDKLREKALDDIVAHIRVESNINTKVFDKTMEDLKSIMENHKKDFDVEVGAEINNTKFIQALDEMMAKAGASTDQIQAILGGMNMSAEFESQDQQMQVKVPIISKTHTVHPGAVVKDLNGNLTAQEWTETEEVTSVKTSEHPINVPAWALGTAVDGKAVNPPKIKAIHKTAPGSAASTPKASSSGGRGGGGGRKAARPKKQKAPDFKDEFDRYWQLNQTIKKVADTLNKLGKQQDYAFGQERIKNIEDQNKALKQQIKNYKALGKEQKKELKELQGIRQKTKDKKGKTHWKDVGKINSKGYVVDSKGRKTGASKDYGAKFDSDGYLANYNEVTKKEYARYKKALQKKYPSEKAQTKAIEKAKERYEEFKKWLSRVEKLTQDEMVNTAEAIAEKNRQIVENNIEKMDLKLSLKIETREAERTWKKFLKTLKYSWQETVSAFTSGELAKNNIKASIDLINDKAIDIQQTNADRQKLLDAYYNWDELDESERQKYGSSKSEVLERIKKKDEEIQQQVDDAASALSDGWNQYIDALNSVSEKFDFLNDRLEEQKDILEYNKELIELTYGDNKSKEAKELRKKSYATELAVLDKQKAARTEELSYWQSVFDQEKALAEANNQTWDPNNIETWSAAGKEAYNNMMTLSGDIRDINLEIINTFRDQYLSKIEDDFIDPLEKLLTGGLSLDDAGTQWERAKAEAEHYLDTTEKTYHIQTLMNKIDQSTQTMKNVKAAQKLKKLREEELKYLSEKNKLTKYDIDAANARYEIALKEIALEEAQQNKNTMKLVRNEQGNWAYQYVADQNDVLTKQQDLMDASYNYYNLGKQNYVSSLEDMSSLQNTYADQLRDIAELDLTDHELALQKRQALDEWYQSESKRLAEENALYQKDMTLSATKIFTEQYDADRAAFEQVNKDKKDFIEDLKNEGIKDFEELFKAFNDGTFKSQALAKEYFLTGDESLSNMFGSTAQHMIDVWTYNEDSVVNMITNGYKDMDTAGENFRESISEITGGKDGIVESFTSVETEVKNVGSQITTLVDTSKNSLKELAQVVIDLATAFGSVVDAAKEVKKVLEDDDEGGYSEGTITVSSGTIGMVSADIGKSTSKGKTVKNKGTGSSKGTSKSKNNGLEASIKSLGGSVTLVGEEEEDDDKDRQLIFSPMNILGLGRSPILFDTGGYTGSWGDAGKMAVLHEKELVLNKQDTKNVLDAVDAIRGIRDLNSSISQTIAESISDIISNSIDVFNSGTKINTDKEDNQKVVIENINANFPNAENVEEIKEALMSLPRIASQYVNRNLK